VGGPRKRISRKADTASRVDPTEGLEDGIFQLCRCAGCQRWLWEMQYGAMDIRCGECGSWDQEWVEVEPDAEVYAWFRTNQAFEGAEAFKNDILCVTIEAESVRTRRAARARDAEG
jgi:uncharacterized protein